LEHEPDLAGIAGRCGIPVAEREPVTVAVAFAEAGRLALGCGQPETVRIAEGLGIAFPVAFGRRSNARPGNVATSGLLARDGGDRQGSVVTDRSYMKFGVMMFPTDQSIRPDDLAREAEVRGFESIFY